MQKRPKIIVVGGGIAGLTAASNLAHRGLDVVLVEREDALGGNALTVCCKAVDGECQLCGGCLLPDRINDVLASNLISVWTQTTVSRLQRQNGGFSLSLENGSGQTAIDADAIILATGFDHVDAHTKGPYGYGILPQVITGQEMEERLCEEGQDIYDALGLEKIAFIQCVGSRDEHVGRGYCSQVCCRYALRLARLLKSRVPDVEVTIFKMDIQNAGRDMAETWRSAQEEGVRIVAGLPAVIRRSEENPDRATFVYNDILADDLEEEGGGLKEEDFDLVVLSVGMQPRTDAEQVAGLFGINRDRYGFMDTRGDHVSTIVPGLFVAGSCEAPRSMAESVAHAERAAEACRRYIDTLLPTDLAAQSGEKRS